MRALKVNSNSKNGGNQKQFLNLKRSKPKRGHYSYLNKERGETAITNLMLNFDKIIIFFSNLNTVIVKRYN